MPKFETKKTGKDFEIQMLGELADAMAATVKFGKRLEKIARICQSTDLDATEKVAHVLKAVGKDIRKLAAKPEAKKPRVTKSQAKKSKPRKKVR